MPHRKAVTARAFVRASLFSPFLFLLVALLSAGHLSTASQAPIANPLLKVTTISDAVDANDGKISLREAVITANSDGVDSAITFDATVFAAKETITLTSGELVLAADGKLSIEGPAAGVVISGNQASRVFFVNEGAEVTLDKLTISNGKVGGGGESSNYGGGIYNDGTLTLTGSTLSDNSVTGGDHSGNLGGGIFNSGRLTLTNSTLSDNFASGGDESGNLGGGIYNSGTVTLTNSTLSGNSASGEGSFDYGGGIYNNEGTVNSGNSIIAGNTADGGGPDVYGPVTANYSLIGGDPLLGELAENGGPTRTHALETGSPAINAGDPNFDDTEMPYDQRGEGYPRVVGGRIDIGAFESDVVPEPEPSAESLIVTTTADEDNGSSDPALGTGTSLREAIAFANSDGVDSAITFEEAGEGVFAAKQTITLGGTQLSLANNGKLSITGPAAGVVISGNQASRVFTVDTGADVMLDNLTIRDGKVTGIINLGGGIYNNGTLTITNSTLSNNSVSGDNSNNSGGGIFNDGTLTLTNSTLSGNSVSGDNSNNSGGGIFNNAVTANIGNSIIAGNTASASPDVFGSFTSQGYNLIGKTDGSTGFTNGVNNDQTGTVAEPLDAKLGPLADNDAPTQTHALLPGSPAIDAGNTEEETDQRGVLRPQPVGGADDIGAFELEQLPVIAPTAVTNDATAITQTTATLNATINPGGGATTAQFEYGIRDEFGAVAYGDPVNITLNPNNGSDDQNVSADITDLLPYTTYGFRVTATNSEGTVNGQEATFTTLENNSLVVDLDRDFSNNDGRTSLREAIAFANSDPDASEITFHTDLAGAGIELSRLGDSSFGRSAVLITSPITIKGLSGDSGIGIAGGPRPRLRYFTVAPNQSLTLKMLSVFGGNVEAASGVDGNSGEAGKGGAIYNHAGTVIIERCTFEGNNASGGSGDGEGNGGDGLGGAIFNDGGTLTVSNSTFSDNYVSGGGGTTNGSAFGGAIYNHNGSATIDSATLAGNYADEGGAFYNFSSSALMPATLTLNNSILSGSLANSQEAPAPKDLYNAASGATSVSGNTNLIQSTNDYGPVGFIVSSADPMLEPLAPNGGPTFTRALQEGSPAINAGNTEEETDQRGVLRPQGAGDDIGAFELEQEPDPNSAPTLTDIEKTAQEDTALAFTAEDFDAGFADDDEDELTTIKITSLPTAGVLLLDGEAVAVNDEIARADISKLTYTPNLNYHSTDSFGWNGSDGTTYAETSALVEITVEEVNDDPTLDEIPTINSDEGVLINFFAHGEDVDTGTVLEYSLVGAPAGASINSATGEFKWTPTEAQGPATYNFQIKVVDGEGGEAIRDVTINVAEVNSAPVLPFVGARTLTYGGTTTYDFAATDSDLPKNDLEYSLIGAPAGASINPQTGLFSWTPTSAQSHNNFYSFKVRVVDNGSPSLSDEENAYFTVQRGNVNKAPVLPFVGARTLYFGSTNTLNFAATDADVPKDTLTYSLIGAPSGASINPTTGVFSWTPTASQAQTNANFYSFKIKVTDDGFPAKSDEETASFTVAYPAEILVNTTGPSLKADNASKSVTLTYTVRNNTGTAQSNLKVQGDVFWPAALQSVTLTPTAGTTATQSTLTSSSKRILWTVPSLPAFGSKTLSIKLTGVVPTNAPGRSRIATGFVLSPVSGTAIPNHTAPEVFLNTYK